ncbi:hypothetical protein [Allosphingosinicella indica]|uniref:Uncharacterized protein n=1 Tax=Allosphingosinicella indica TaxID=941907 RepID=A0A1X7GAM2_9SPHN|nr:hypothetical protein [Allosphingosinicella indica]SMF66855.1 hypothetical protein SAMN06295910_1444 [Allosphingosinicella indica]
MSAKTIAVSTVVLAAAMAMPASAQKKPEERPAAYEALMRCRGVADSAERLACFDQATAALQTATDNREVVMVDRQQIRKTRRTLFGLALPDFNLFGGGDDEKEEDEVKQIETTVANAFVDQNGKWALKVAEGATWRQTDNNVLGRKPRPGSKIVISRSALGSYMAKIDGQPSIRVRRDQ